MAIAVALCLAPAAARALEPARTLVIAGQSLQGGPDAPVERKVREVVSERKTHKLLPPPALDLEAVQLAIDCAEPSEACLRSVAERLEARVLIIPSVERSRGKTTLHILYFDVEAGKPPREVHRRTRGDAVDDWLLAGIPELIEELLGKEPDPEPEPSPAPELQPAEPEPTPAPAQAVQERQTGGGSKLAPVLIGAGGLAAVTAGLVLGAMMMETEEEYAAQPIQTEAQARMADAIRARGEDQALAATLLLGVGTAAVVTAGVWFAIASSSLGEAKPATQAALVPAIGPRQAGVMLLGTWEPRRP